MDLGITRDMIPFIPFDVPKLWLARTILVMPPEQDRMIQTGSRFDSDLGCTVEEFFEIKTPCCEWHGWNNGEGHGKFRHLGKIVYVHRHSLMLMNPELKLKTSDYVDHRCRNRACWNPHHLEAVDPWTNIQRGDNRPYKTRDDYIAMFEARRYPDEEDAAA